jgi:hypothetical protein
MVTAVKEMAEATKTNAIDSTASLENLEDLFPLLPMPTTLLLVVGVAIGRFSSGCQQTDMTSESG